MITAIGTGVREEFNLEDARYHKIIVMTDADVDGAHIRTLVLTFLYRELPDLIEAGYVYIATPPLYKVKNGRIETYIEKESELEELLLRDKLEQIRRSRRRRQAAQADHGALAAVQPPLQGVRGLGGLAAGRVRPRRRSASSPSRRSSTRGAATLAGVREAARRPDPEGEPFDTEILVRVRRRARGSRRPSRDGLARTYKLSAALFASSDYRHLVEVHEDLLKQVGRPPFTVAARRQGARGGVVRRAAPRGARARPPGSHDAALQGPRRDERRAAARDDDGSRLADAAAGDRSTTPRSRSGSSPS